MTLTATQVDNKNASSSTKGDRNRRWRERAHLQLDALLDDAIVKKGFHGHVEVTILLRDNFIIGINADLKQTIRH